MVDEPVGRLVGDRVVPWAVSAAPAPVGEQDDPLGLLGGDQFPLQRHLIQRYLDELLERRHTCRSAGSVEKATAAARCSPGSQPVRVQFGDALAVGVELHRMERVGLVDVDERVVPVGQYRRHVVTRLVVRVVDDTDGAVAPWLC